MTQDKIENITKRLAEFPRLNNSLTPTPIHRLDFLNKKYGAEVWCKRDDLTGFAFGGNKTRKLDFLIPQALSQGCDCMIAIGANQSNFCRMAAGYAAAAGLETHLVLGGDKPDNPTGNLRIDHLLGAKVYHVSSTEWDDWARAAKNLEAELIRKGRRVFRLPVGGSTPIGALGYVEAWAEIARDQGRIGKNFSTIIHSSSSAGTQAGLVVGRTMTESRTHIWGISVAKPAKILAAEVFDLAQQTARMLKVPAPKINSIEVDDSFLGTQYGSRTTECEEAVEMFARHSGIFLDYVYSGKAAAALIEYLKQGRFQTGEKILFIHTGGNIELFA